jgi:hypothetical protein
VKLTKSPLVDDVGPVGIAEPEPARDLLPITPPDVVVTTPAVVSGNVTDPVKVGLALGASAVRRVPESATCPPVPVKVATSPVVLVVGPVVKPAPLPDKVAAMIWLEAFDARALALVGIDAPFTSIAFDAVPVVFAALLGISPLNRVGN